MSEIFIPQPGREQEPRSLYTYAMNWFKGSRQLRGSEGLSSLDRRCAGKAIFEPKYCEWYKLEEGVVRCKSKRSGCPMSLRNEARCKERMVIFPRPEIPVKSSLKPSSQHLNEYGLRARAGAGAGARMPNHCIVSLGRDGGRLAVLAGWLAGGQGSGLAHLIHRHHRPRPGRLDTTQDGETINKYTVAAPHLSLSFVHFLLHEHKWLHNKKWDWEESPLYVRQESLEKPLNFPRANIVVVSMAAHSFSPKS